MRHELISESLFLGLFWLLCQWDSMPFSVQHVGAFCSVCVCTLRFQEFVSYSVRRGHGGRSPGRADKAMVFGWKRSWTQYLVPANF